MSGPLVEVDRVVRRYALPRERLLGPAPELTAVDGVSLEISAGRSLGVVGESGSGKSTLARLVMALERPTEGSVRFLGRDLNALGKEALRRARCDFQMVFQDPYGSLDPRQTVARIVVEPLTAIGRVPSAESRERARDALHSVGLRTADLDKYPHEFSGGQRQRIAIARALVTRPKLIVADEPVSALDVSVQAQVLNLLQDLQDEFGVTYLLISHDLAVVDHVCDEVAVMYRGRVVEQGSPETLFRAAAHPYTRMLLDAVPRARPGGARRRVAGNAAVNEASAARAASGEGCAFLGRCAHARERCANQRPALLQLGPGHWAACHYPAQAAGPVRGAAGPPGQRTHST